MVWEVLDGTSMEPLDAGATYLIPDPTYTGVAALHPYNPGGTPANSIAPDVDILLAPLNDTHQGVPGGSPDSTNTTSYVMGENDMWTPEPGLAELRLM